MLKEKKRVRYEELTFVDCQVELTHFFVEN